MKTSFRISRRTFVGGVSAAAVFGSARRSLGATAGKLEKPKLTVGLAVNAASFWPLYVAASETWKKQGIEGTLTAFRGDAQTAQALAGNSIDISVQSPDALINLINSNQPIIGFYAGFYQSDYAWLAQPDIKSWDQIKGKTMGISTFGSQTEQLTTYALSRHGLVAGKDVKLLQVGPPATGGYQALKSGRVAATIQSPPTKWMAQDSGFNLIGTQAKDVAAEWPKHIILAKKKFLDDNPETVKAFLRAHVEAIRLMKSNRALATKILATQLKFQPPYVEKAYDELVPLYNERGTLPEKYMSTYWDIQIKNGSVKQAWPDSKLLDERFVKTFAAWAP